MSIVTAVQNVNTQTETGNKLLEKLRKKVEKKKKTEQGPKQF